ncbi:amino acid ABC transporter substrate-binding protein [Thalassospira sp. HF15]|uniref:transporter substrate-binding domain-containing protein n=1 Tax=Thalassospira sp. HF15 TaxID=2722755 RepID=UPI001431A5FE|nr:transporter substrate-binding domain-containing protein [Thalassospira sp. HF15]NIY76884.1 amino acid ABC transporter substrate-binding protein [Thalassospira sp. HF15]
MSRCFWLICISLLTFVSAAGPSVSKAQTSSSQATSDCKGKKLCIGVRSHARPFSFKPESGSEIITDGTHGPLARKGYTGYMVRICDAALKEMTLNIGDDEEILAYSDIGVVDIDTRIETGKKNVTFETTPGLDGSRLSYLGQDFDILCDPATITNDRRSDFTVSAPLFLTGVSYITLAGENRSGAPLTACSTDHNLIGVVKGTNTSYAIQALANTNELPSYKKEINTYLNGSEVCTRTLSIYQTFKNDEQAAKALCEGKVAYIADPSEELQKEITNSDNCIEPTSAKYAKYLVNASNAIQSRNNQPCHRRYPLVGIVVAEKDPASKTEARIKEAQIPSPAANGQKSTLTGKETCKPDQPLVRSFNNHKEAAKAFCQGEIFYYVGDLEIITANAQAVAGCNYENGSQTYTTDRYAIFGKTIEQNKSGVKIQDPERRLRVAQFFEILSRKTVFTPSILDAAFESTFHGRDPSERLADFYESIRGTYSTR